MSASRVTGVYETIAIAGESVAAFVPSPLPPIAPVLQLDEAMREQLRRAEEALLRLELAGEMVPSLDWFIYGFVRKEAVLSSQIEGTQATLIDLLNFEAEGTEEAPGNADLREVCNYLEALDYARAQLADAGRAAAVDAPVERSPCPPHAGGTRRRTSSPAKSAAAKTGSAAPVRATPLSCRLRPTGSPNCSPISRSSCMRRATNCRRWSGRAAARPVRDHPPLPRRQRPDRPPVGHAVA